MRKYISYLFILFLALTSLKVYTQGCSDAGFCTMGAMRPGQPYSKNTNITLKSIELSQYIGITRLNDQIYATALDFNIGISEKDAIQFKLPYMSTVGPLGQ